MCGQDQQQHCRFTRGTCCNVFTPCLSRLVPVILSHILVEQVNAVAFWLT